MSVQARQAARQEQEQRRLAQFQNQGAAALNPDPRFMAGPNAINAPAGGPTAPPPVTQPEEPVEEPTLPNATSAVRLAELAKKRGVEGMGEAKYNQAMSLLRDYEQANPGEMAKANSSTVRAKWAAENIERSPMPSSFAARDKKQRDITSRVMIPRQRLEDLPPDARERVLRQEEEAGLDSTSGFGENISQVMSAAAKLDSPRIKRAFLETSVRDEIEKAGITLPEGQDVVGLNENLNEVMFLRPTEDGKLRWTLSNSEVFRLRDFGAIADPDKLLSAVGAAAGAIFGKNRASVEFGGDLIGRNLGLAIEYALSSGEATPDDLMAAMLGTPFESAFDTIVSRATGRLLDSPERKTRLVVADQEAADRANSLVAEATETMETIQKITGGKSVSISVAEASGDDVTLIAAKSKEKNASAKNKRKIEGFRLENQRILDEATEKALGPSASSPRYDPYQAVEDVQHSVAKAHRDAKIKTDDAAAAPVAHEDLIVPTTDEIADGVEMRTYRFAGDETKYSPNAELDGAGFNRGARIVVDHNKRTVHLTDVFAGKKTQGQTIALLDHAYADVAGLNYTMASGDIVSPEAQNMIKSLNKSGWSISQNPNAKPNANGHLRTEDGSPVFTVDGAPGDVVLSKEFAEDSFDRMAIEGELDNFEQMLPAAEQFANDSNAQLLGLLGWSKQTRRSNYTLDNPSSTGLRAQIRALQNRNRQALTQSEASDGEKLLAAATRRETDDEGNDFLAGLAAEEVDFANVLTARDRLGRIAQETGDPDAVRLVQTLDNLIKNGKMRSVNSNFVPAEMRASINTALATTRSANGFVREAREVIQTSRLFQKNRNGEYMYSNIKDWDTLMAGGARFIKNLKPLIDSSPTLKQESAAVLRQLYREKVMKDGTWSRQRHDAYMNRYSESLPTVFDEKDLAELAKYELAPGKEGLWNRLVGRATEKASKATSFVAGAKTPVVATKALPDKLPPTPIKINAKKIIESINDQPFGRTEAYMTWVKKNDPAAFASLQDTAKQQIQTKLQSKFFNPDDAGPMTGAKANRLKEWYNVNKDTIRYVLGEDYYVNLGAIVKANDITARSFLKKGAADEPQTIVTRAFRSLIGPLSKPQRQLSAAQFAKMRMSGRKAIQLISDPAAIAEISAAARQGMIVESQAGIALFSRLGLWSDFGLVGDPTDPEYQAQAMAIWEQIKGWTGHDATVEQEQ